MAGDSSGSLPVDRLLRLDGKVALVTGGAGGIGAGISRRFYEAGATVAVHATAAGMARATALAATLGERAFAVAGDVERDADAIVAAVMERCGRLDVCVNNAAVQPVSALLATPAEEAVEVLRVDLGGIIAITTAAARAMQGGAICTIASIEGMQPAAGHAHYSAAKAGAIMHARAAALELGPLGIRVNVVAPGLIDRPGLADDWPSGVQRWMQACPLGRLGQPDDVADAVLFLCSPAARWVSGAVLTVDGGTLTNTTW